MSKKLVRYTKEQVEFLEQNYKGRTTQELADLFNERFGTNLTATHMRSAKQCRGWKSGVDTRFKNGNPYVYKNGDIPPNKLPEGTVRNCRKFTYIKKNGEWIPLHRHVWEQAHGPLKKNELVLFKDGDHTNCSLDNLYKSTYAEQLYFLQKNMTEVPKIPELRFSATLVSRLFIIANERMKDDAVKI